MHFWNVLLVYGVPIILVELTSNCTSQLETTLVNIMSHNRIEFQTYL